MNRFRKQKYYNFNTLDNNNHSFSFYHKNLNTGFITNLKANPMDDDLKSKQNMRGLPEILNHSHSEANWNIINKIKLNQSQLSSPVNLNTINTSHQYYTNNESAHFINRVLSDNHIDPPVIQETPFIKQKNIEMAQITSLKRNEGVQMCHIGGNEYAKTYLQDLLQAQTLLPDHNHILVYGPPGVGKTMLAKALLNTTPSSHCLWVDLPSLLHTSPSSSPVQLLHALFLQARLLAPTLLVLDEMDHWLRQALPTDSSETLSVKHCLLNQMDSKQNTQVQVLITTSQPWELDASALRRLPHKLFLPVPSYDDRLQLFSLCLNKYSHTLSPQQIISLVQASEDYTGSDIHTLINSASFHRYTHLIKHSQSVINQSFGTQLSSQQSTIRPITYVDILKSMRKIKSSISKKLIEQHLNFVQKQGITDQIYTSSPTTSDSDHNNNKINGKKSFKRENQIINAKFNN